MNTILQVLTVLAALLGGYSLASQGVLTGRAIGAIDCQVWRWRIVVRTLQFRHDKLFYQAVIATA